MKIFISFTLLLTLSVSHLSFSSSSEEEKKPNVQAMIKSLGSSIPVLPSSSITPSSSTSSLTSASTESPKPKRKFSLSLKSSSSSIKKEKEDQSSRSESPKKQQESIVQSSPSSARLGGFSYTSPRAGSNLLSPRSSSLSLEKNNEESTIPSIAPPLQASAGSSSPYSSSLNLKPKQEEIAIPSTSSSPELSGSSPSRSRSKSKSSKSEFVLSRPVAINAFVTIKDPEAELQQLLTEAISLCGSIFESIGSTEKDSNKKIDLVVKSMIDDLKLSIEKISKKKSEAELLQAPQERAKLLGDSVSFFHMTVNRAQNQLPFAIKWAMGETLENTDLEKYFTTMFQDASKSEEVILSEHLSTKTILMDIGRTLYISLVEKQEARKSDPQYNQDRAAVVDILFKEYISYMNGMDDELKRSIGNAIAFNSLNRDFNPTINLMRKNLMKALDWMVGIEKEIETALLDQFNSKLEELTRPSSSMKTT